MVIFFTLQIFPWGFCLGYNITEWQEFLCPPAYEGLNSDPGRIVFSVRRLADLTVAACIPHLTHWHATTQQGCSHNALCWLLRAQLPLTPA